MPERDPDVLAALHRFYIATLPPHHRRRIEERTSERVRAMDLPEALSIVASTPAVDRLTKWHLTATALHRNPTDFTRPAVLGRLVDVIGTKPEPRGRERAAMAMGSFAQRDRPGADASETAPTAPTGPDPGEHGGPGDTGGRSGRGRQAS